MIRELIKQLEREYPDAECALHYTSPEQLLFATILSAQCTDVQVNKVTPLLFKKYPCPKELAKAKQKDVENIIRSTGFFKNKAKNIIACSKILVEKYKGKVPQSLEELVQLPGVGRKTANVVLGESFDIPGVVVDTHVKRLTNLIGLVDIEDPVKIEFALMEVVPKKYWSQFSFWLILHGRKICIANRPKCFECVIQRYCEYGRKQLRM